MRFCRKHINNKWETLEVSKKEFEKVRCQAVKEIKKVLTLICDDDVLKKLSDSERAVVLDKLAPSIFSVLDDYVCTQIKEKYKDE